MMYKVRQFFRYIKSKMHWWGLLAVLLIAVEVVGTINDYKPHLKEDSVQGYMDWSKGLSYAGYYDAAVRAAESAVQQAPEDVKTYINLAEIHLENLQYDKAKAVYTDAQTKLEDTALIDEKLAHIDNVAITNIEPANSIQVSKNNEDTLKYDNTRYYNSNGDVVYYYGRTRDWRMTDLKTIYEYDANNNLVRETNFVGKKLAVASDCIIYEYDADNNLTVQYTCDYTGQMDYRKHFDKAGVETKREVYAQDGSCDIIRYSAEAVVSERERYSPDGEMMYLFKYEPSEDEDFDEKITCYDRDDNVVYYSMNKYLSAVKSIKRESYYNADGTHIVSIVLETDKQYYIYEDEQAHIGTQTGKYTFYDEAIAYVNEMLNN